MYKSEIDKYMKKDKQFIGCFAFDSLPNFPLDLPAKLIINTGASTTEGEHWIALLMNQKKCFYFDSFGLPVLNLEILRFLGIHYKKLTYSNKCIQNYSSDKCGQFCIDFLKRVKNKYTYLKFLKNFHDINLSRNDKII